MSVKFLDPERRLPAEPRERIDEAFRLLMNAQHAEADEILRGCVADQDDLVKAFAHLYLGDIAHFQWDFDPCLEHYQQAVEQFRSLGHDRGRIFTEMRLADIYTDQADTSGENATERMLQAKRQSMDLLDAASIEAERLQDDFLIAFGHHYRGLLNIEAGRYEDAMTELQLAVKLRDSIGDDVYGPSSECLLARCMAELDDCEGGLRLAEEVYLRQMESNLRGPALRTLVNIGYINEKRSLDRMAGLTSQFTAVEPVAQTPFLDALKRANEMYRGPLVKDLDVQVMALHA